MDADPAGLQMHFQILSHVKKIGQEENDGISKKGKAKIERIGNDFQTIELGWNEYRCI